MKRIWLFAFFFCFTASIASAQIRFSKYYGIEKFNDLSIEVLSLEDSGYFTITQSVDFFNEDTLGFAITAVLFIRTNKYGDTLWTKKYHKKHFNISFNSYIMHNDDFYLVGTEIDLVKFQNNQKEGYLTIWKVDSNGDTLITNNYDISIGSEYSQQLISTIDSAYVIVGQACNNINSAVNCDLLLLKFNSNCEVEWVKTFSNTNNSFESGFSIVQHSNEDYYLVGYTQESGIREGLIIKTNKDGLLIWKKSFNNFQRQTCQSIIIDKDESKIYIAGYYNTSNSGNGIYKGFIIKLDTNKTNLWIKSYGDSSDLFIFSILLNESKNIVVCGSKENMNSVNDGWLSMMDKNGIVIYDFLYNNSFNKQHNLYRINKAYDGYILVGFGDNPLDSVQSQDAWLLKVDTFGCLTPGCQLVGIHNIPFSREEIKIYPNPANNKIQFEHSAKIISYRIADYTGKFLLEGTYNSINIDVSALPTGAYIVQVMLEDGSQAFGKMVVE